MQHKNKQIKFGTYKYNKIKIVNNDIVKEKSLRNTYFKHHCNHINKLNPFNILTATVAIKTNNK